MATSKMKCHYEILNLERNATDEEIKKSYRKLALKCHPDKNPENIEECTKQFHLLQQAYEVLIDPQERAWYDKHREAILKGGLGHGDNYEDNSLDVYQYFNTSCYSGYGDDVGSFYTVYSEVFNTIATEDVEYRDESIDESIPGFGNSKSSYEDVVGPFYAYWEGYCTAKSYVWVEKYDTREAPNRQVRRAMEQENKKLRDKAKKERNEEVRALVAFVRKRDKRVQSYKKKLEERALEIEKKTQEKKKKQKQEKLKKFEDYKEADWSAIDRLEEQLDALEMEHSKNFGDNEEDSEDEVEIGGEGSQGLEPQSDEEDELLYDDLYCIACNKPFKTQKAFDNHENSKKHRQNVESLKNEMAEEDAELENESNLTNTKADKVENLEEEEDDLLMDTEVLYDDLYCQFCDKFFTDESALYNHTLSKKHRDTVAAIHPDFNTEEEPEIVETNTNALDATDEAATVEETQCKEKDNSKQTSSEENNSNTTQTNTDNEKHTEKPQNQQKQTESKQDWKCNVCHQSYPTRNKMFKHIKETGHALRVDNPPPQAKSSGKQKKNKKNKSKS